MNKNILTVILVTINIFLCVYILKMSSDRSIANNMYYELINVVEETSHNVMKKYKYERDDFFIAPTHKSVIDSLFNGESNIIKLFYRIGFPYCDSCIYPVIENVAKMSSDVGKENIVVITGFPSDEYGRVLIKYLDDINVNHINIPPNELGIHTSDIVGSYLFSMNKLCYIDNLYFAGKYNPHMLSEYLLYMKRAIKTVSPKAMTFVRVPYDQNIKIE